MLSAASEATARSRDVNSNKDDVISALDNALQKLTSLKRKVSNNYINWLLYSNYFKNFREMSV